MNDGDGGEDVVRRERFSGGPAREFLSSLDADRRIFAADLAVDRAHVVMLAEQDIVPDEEASEILAALDDVAEDGHGALPEGEDVHAAIETAIIDRVGPVGGKMHTARSRNDEVAACIRHRLRDDLLDAVEATLALRETLAGVAADHTETVMPGYTHLQPAQPTTLAHYLLSYEGAVARDTARLLDAYDRTNRSPLGAAALAGTPFDVDRERVAELLGFHGGPASSEGRQSLGQPARSAGDDASGTQTRAKRDVALVENAMDAAAGRDFLLESVSALATHAIHLSGVAEDLVVYANRGLVELDDDYASTSSIMPQKKNPDTLELVRATAGDAAGDLQGLLTTLKGLPRAYNRDLQRATPHAWNAADAVVDATDVVAGAVATAEWPTEALREAAGEGFATATGVADLLAMHGVPFRTAHEIVARAAERGADVAALRAATENVTGDALDELVPVDAVERALDPAESVAMRDSRGGPAPERTTEAAARAAADADTDRAALSARREALATAAGRLDAEVGRYV